MDVPAGVTREEGHSGFLILIPSAVLALIFLSRRIQPFLSLVDLEVEFGTGILCSNDLIVLHLFGINFVLLYFCEEKSQLPGFELTSQRVRRFQGYQLNHRGDRLVNYVIIRCGVQYFSGVSSHIDKIKVG